MITAVIFDADGTLLDSMTFWQEVVNNLLISMNVKPDDNLTEILTPMSMLEGAEYIRNKYNLKLSAEEIVDTENKIVEEFYLNSVEMRSGTIGLLQYLKANNIPMTIATATDRKLIEGALSHLNIAHYFDRVFSCSEIGEGKGSPTIYLGACQFMNSQPCHTLVAEDSLQGLTTAKNAGFKTLALYDKTQSSMWDKIKTLGDLSIKGGFDMAAIKNKFFTQGD